MDTHEQRIAAYLVEMRAKYAQSEVDELGAKGHAFGPDDEGHYSYPIDDVEDLKKAVKAIGRGDADHDDIRKYVIGRAEALGESEVIPDNWNSDGSLKAESKSRMARSVEWRMKRAADMKGTERRLRLERVEIRESDDGKLHLSGYANVTESPYDMGWYTEEVAQGAAKKTLAENPDVVLNINHGEAGSGLPIARTKADTLSLTEDRQGLKVDAELDPEDPDVQLLNRKMASGNLDGQMSFAFRVTRQEWNDDYTHRRITEYDIHRGDVSVVTQGANPATASSIRTDDAIMALRHMGPLGVIEALLDLRRFAGTPLEDRAGKTLSSATTEVLTHLLSLCSTADEAMDEAQPLLADLMGVPNPDEDDGDGDGDSSGGDATGDEGRSQTDPPTPPAVTVAPIDFRADRARLEAHRHASRRAA